jgi:hypothetical protein
MKQAEFEVDEELPSRPNSGPPLPVTAAAAGFMFAAVLPGGLTAGEGFLAGLGVGFLITLGLAYEATRPGAENGRRKRVGPVFQEGEHSS